MTTATLFEGEDWMGVLEALHAGDTRALTKVTGVIKRALARMGAQRFQDSWDDVCQEVLIALSKAFREGSLRDPSKFVSFTRTITRYKLTDWFQRQSKADFGCDADLESEVGLESSSLAETQFPGVLVDLQRALGTLPDRQRSVMDAIYVNGMTYREAADHLDMPLGTLKRLQTCGLKKLRQAMNGAGSAA